MEKEVKKEVYELAKFMHEEYENSARLFGWITQETTRVDFDALPEAHKKTMLSLAFKVFKKIYGEL